MKHQPTVTPGGLSVVNIVKAPWHNKRFVIAKRPDKREHSDYVVEALNADGTFSKRTPEVLWSTTFESRSDARYAIRKWDTRNENRTSDTPTSNTARLKDIARRHPASK